MKSQQRMKVAYDSKSRIAPHGEWKIAVTQVANGKIITFSVTV